MVNMLGSSSGEPLGLRQMRYVAALADEGSIRLASAFLALPPRVLAAELAAAERAVGTRLFRRLPRSIVPTAAGRELAELGRHALAGAARENRAAAGGAQALRVGTLEYGRGKVIKRAAIAEFQSRFPHLPVEIVSTTFVRQLQAVVDGALNAGFCAGPRPLPPGLASVVLDTESVGSAMLPGRHPLATRSALSLHDLRADPVVRLEQSLTTPILYDEMSRRGWRGRFTSGTPSHAAVIKRIANGAGWSPMTSATRGWEPRGVILVPLLDGPFIRFDQEVAWREGDPVAAAFVRLMLDLRDAFDAAPPPPGAQERAAGGGARAGRGSAAAGRARPERRDALLQAVVGSELLLEAVRRRLPPELAEESRQLALVIQGLEAAAREERGALEAPEPPAGAAPDLARTLTAAAEKLGVGARCRFTLKTFGAPLPLHPATEDAAYRIAVEALVHAFGNPCASAVTLSIGYNRERFRLVVAVDGPGGGARPAALSPILRWTEGVGGTLSLRARRRQGARFSVLVPGGTAYDT
jgi:DNA-binding transcriptional LysR family regulator